MISLITESTTEQTFVRFGKRFKHGKSINYLAMNPRIKDIYSERLAELQYGYISEEEFTQWCEDVLEDYVWEPHVSCFYCDPKTFLPIINNVSQTKTLIGFIRRLECELPCDSFLVKGKQVGVGTDKEPLVDVTEEETIVYEVEDLIDVVIDALKKGFEYSQPSEDHYYDELTYIGVGLFVYKDMLFANPKKDFIKDFEYKGPVMDKFKYEEPIDIDYDDIRAIKIDSEDNGSMEEIGDMIYEWGDTILEKPFYFENQYHIAVEVNERLGYLLVIGSDDAIEDFLSEFPVEYIDLDDVPDKLLNRYQNMKFYE